MITNIITQNLEQMEKNSDLQLEIYMLITEIRICNGIQERNLNFQFSVNKKKMTAIYLRKTPYVHCGDHHSAKALSKNKLQSV